VQFSQIPTKIPVPWGNSAGGGFIRVVPIPSQIGITAGAASWTDGFVPVNFSPVGAGGTPPFGEDMNGALNPISAWIRWFNAGAPLQYDSSFSSSIGGYPKGAILSNASTVGLFWISTVDNNTTDPDTGGANWTGFTMASATSVAAGTYLRTKVTFDQYGRATAATSGAQPTYQRFTSGSGTYTAPTGVVRSHVRMCGGGGGANSSGNGGNTTFGNWGAEGGGQGTSAGSAGAGGSGGGNGTGTLFVRASGANGQSGVTFSNSGNGNFGYYIFGGYNRFGGGTNSGAGGVATGTIAYNNSSITTPGGGGAGEYVEFDYPNPTSINYQIGAGGGTGIAGVIEVAEYYD
jgi:hypothetical protein